MKSDEEKQRGWLNGVRNIPFAWTQKRSELLLNRTWVKVPNGYYDGAKRAPMAAVARAMQSPLSTVKVYHGGRVTVQYSDVSYFEGVIKDGGSSESNGAKPGAAEEALGQAANENPSEAESGDLAPAQRSRMVFSPNSETVQPEPFDGVETDRKEENT